MICRAIFFGGPVKYDAAPFAGVSYPKNASTSAAGNPVSLLLG
jgi:hypothetical protein